MKSVTCFHLRPAHSRAAMRFTSVRMKRNQMTPADEFMLGLTLYREARGEGRTGMIAVGCVVRNRMAKNGTSAYIEIVKPAQFTSISVHTDPEIALWPAEADPLWQSATFLAPSILDGSLSDITGGATLYYNPASIPPGKTITLLSGISVRFPATWNLAAVAQTVQIGAHVFFRELPVPHPAS